MTEFATEFPCVPEIGRDDFVAGLVKWLQGNPNSHVLNDLTAEDLEGETDLNAHNGERLLTRDFKDEDGEEAFGFRHLIPDPEGRIWRTEAVLRKPGFSRERVIYLRVRCLAGGTDAHLIAPRKPYIIKTMLKDGWASADAGLAIQDRPIKLAEAEDPIGLAAMMLDGGASTYLPIVYLSCQSDGGWCVNDKALDDLAYGLGGVAHVVLEPDRAFSFELRERVDDRNPYDGAVAIAAPGRGIVKRFFRGWRYPSDAALASAIQRTAMEVRTRMPRHLGWGWSDFQEAYLAEMRRQTPEPERDTDWEDLLHQEIADKDEEIRLLKEQLESRDELLERMNAEGFLSPEFVERLGDELYAGEFSDRIMSAVTSALKDETLDGRSRAILQRLGKRGRFTDGAGRLRDSIKRATRSDQAWLKELPKLLQSLGYERKSQGKHATFVHGDPDSGLESTTFASTPGDGRAAANTRKQIERIMGLHRLR